jgi:phospholipid/cholesterol/gamma-HCH transport system permease protein
MRVTEELDAMRVMGIAHGWLVMPRALALAIVMPLISVDHPGCAVSGMLAATAAMGITPSYFINSPPGAVDVANLWLATSKSVVWFVDCAGGLPLWPARQAQHREPGGTTASVVTVDHGGIWSTRCSP